MSKTKMLAIVLNVFGCIFFSSAVSSAQIRTVLVSPVPGDSLASGTSLRNALAGISSPSSTNRWLLKIEPGIYDIQSSSLQLRPWVDVEGSGQDITTIRMISVSSGPPTIVGASNAELRMLTVQAIGGSQVGELVAMFNDNANPRLYRVKFVTQSTQSHTWGMRNWSSAPKIEECEFSVTSGGAMLAYGITFVGFISGPRSSILRSRIAVSGGTNYGIYMSGGQTVTDIQDTRIDAIGGSETTAIYAAAGGWEGGEQLALRNVVISSAGGSVRSAGIWLEGGTTVSLDIYNSKIWGHVAPQTYGIFQGGNIAGGVRFSSIVGVTKTVQYAGNISIAWTELIGGPVTASGWLGCMGVVDEMGVFYPNSCPQ